MTTKLQLKPGQSLDAHVRQEIIFEIRGLIEDGKSSLPTIQKLWGVSRPTANKWRAMALQQMEKTDSGFTRDAVRAMQVGRINRMLERLTDTFNTLLDAGDIDGAAKIAQQIKGHQDSMANITGIKIDTHINVDATQPLVIIRKSDAVTQAQQTEDAMSHNVVEGDIINGSEPSGS